MRVEGRGGSGVLVVGVADKFAGGNSFSHSSPAGSVLHRAIRRIGVEPEMFWLWEASAYEMMTELNDRLEHYQPRAVIALGNEALAATTGLSGRHLGVSHLAGYVLPPVGMGCPVIPTFHPSFLRMKHMSHFGILMRALRLAIQVAKERRQPFLPSIETPPDGYILYPTEAVADDFARRVEAASTTEGFLAYDIETMYSTNEEEAEVTEITAANFNDIRSVQFSLGSGSGIFLPWREPFIGCVKRCLAAPVRKLNWNGWRFDDPRLRENGCTIAGEVIDLMWAWHHLQPDLPRGLQFAAAHQGPRIYSPSASWPWPWKHLDHQSPQFYGIVDVDVLQWMVSY